MNPTNIILLSLSGLSSFDLVHTYIAKSIINFDRVIEEPADTVSIITTSLNEEKNIEKCLSSINNQDIIKEYPDKFELILVDSSSKDNTVELAKPYVDKIVIAPKGKINSKILSIQKSKGNIIVATDSDAYYPNGWLNTLLKPFHDSSVSAVHGSNVDFDVSIIGGKLFNILHPIYVTFISPYEMNGGNCAFWKHFYYMSGGYNPNINQVSFKEVQKEEEKIFGYKLSKLGKIVYKINAPKVHLGSERTKCRRTNGNNCKKYKIGIERFDNGKPEYFV